MNNPRLRKMAYMNKTVQRKDITLPFLLSILDLGCILFKFLDNPK